MKIVLLAHTKAVIGCLVSWYKYKLIMKFRQFIVEIETYLVDILFRKCPILRLTRNSLLIFKFVHISPGTLHNIWFRTSIFPGITMTFLSLEYRKYNVIFKTPSFRLQRVYMVIIFFVLISALTTGLGDPGFSFRVKPNI